MVWFNQTLFAKSTYRVTEISAKGSCADGQQVCLYQEA
jgi:hypothetical protein